MNDSQIRVGENSTEEFLVLIVAPKNATNDYSLTLTLVAQSALDESNDFAVIQIAITTRPPPEFTENVSKLHKPICLKEYRRFFFPTEIWRRTLISY